MTLPPSLLDRLESELSGISARVGAFVGTVQTDAVESGGGFIWLGPPVRFGKPSIEAKAVQTVLTRDWVDWESGYVYLLEALPSEQRAAAQRELERARNWLELGDNSALTMSPAANERAARADVDKLAGPLDVLRHAYDPVVSVVPDTNSLVRCPDFGDYRIVGGDQFEIVLLPTVLGELDKLKVAHRSEDFRRKVEGIVGRLKEMRRRGDVVEGVSAVGKIRLRFVAREPRFDRTLNWLDPGNMDDRIVASALEIQRTNPASSVILVTGDINLQNKAASARLPYAETPPRTGAAAGP